MRRAAYVPAKGQNAAARTMSCSERVMGTVGTKEASIDAAR